MKYLTDFENRPPIETVHFIGTSETLDNEIYHALLNSRPDLADLENKLQEIRECAIEEKANA